MFSKITDMKSAVIQLNSICNQSFSKEISEPFDREIIPITPIRKS